MPETSLTLEEERTRQREYNRDTISRRTAAGAAEATRQAGGTVRHAGSDTKQFGSAFSSPPGGMGAGRVPGTPMAGMQGGAPPYAIARAASQRVNAAAAKVGAYIPGAGKLGGAAAEKVASITQDIAELSPSLTVVGVIITIYRLHERLIWGNMFYNQYWPAQPLAAPNFWFIVLLIVDLVLAAIGCLVVALLYMVMFPCDFYTGLLPAPFNITQVFCK